MVYLDKTDCNISIQSKGRVLRVVREHYLRDEIACGSEFCNDCHNGSHAQTLSKDANYLIIPFIDVIPSYLEIFEHCNIQNVIYTQTVVNNTLHNSGGRRYFDKIRRIVKNNDQHQIFFPNEHHVEIFVHSSKPGDSREREQKIIFRTAQWYKSHIRSDISIIILSENKNFKDQFGSIDKHIFVLGISEFLTLFLKDCDEIMSLYHSIRDVLRDNAAEDQSKIYPEHLNIIHAENGVKIGKYFQGILKVDKHRSSLEASLSTTLTNKPTEIYIFGMKNRNRAVHEDEVIVELLPNSEWKSPSRALANNNYAEKENEDAVKTVPCARVVCIARRNWRDYIASFNLDRDYSDRKSGQKLLAIPFDIRIPKIRISTRKAEKLANQRFVVKIDCWPANSQYPNGHFVREVGNIGEIETETLTILTEYQVDFSPFSKSLLAELPSPTEDDPWRPDESEIKKRLDLRNSHFTLSIDPIGCEDVDDTISVRRIDESHFELGVHIADVTHFVDPGSLCDLEAQRRSTTIYMADRRFDMLPAVLSGNICSLLSGTDRYAVSVIWTLNNSFEIVDVWYGKTVIHSKYKMFYEAAQNIINDVLLCDMKDDISEFENLCVSEQEAEFDHLKRTLNLLHDVSHHFKQKRLIGGGLELNSTEVEVQFESNSNENVEDLKPKQPLEIHDTVAELMIMANTWVAKQIFENFPHNSLLRRHPYPDPKRLESLIDKAAIKGFKIDIDSNESLAKSLNSCVDPSDQNFEKMLRKMATLAMPKALYFSTGSLRTELFYHYGLGLEQYTHFTSPIRRYADVIVHRLLIASISPSKCENNISNCVLQELCEHINDKTIAAQHVQRASLQLFQLKYFIDKAKNDEYIEADAIISDIKSNGFLIDLPLYGISGAVFLKDGENRVLFFADNDNEENFKKWMKGDLNSFDHQICVCTEVGNQTYTIFDHVTVLIKPIITNRLHTDRLSFELTSRKSRIEKYDLNSPQKSHVQSLIAAEKQKAASSTEIHNFEPTKPSLYQVLQSLRDVALSCNS